MDMSNIKDKVWLYLIAFLLVAIAGGGAVLAIRRSAAEPVELKLSPAAAATTAARVLASGAVASPGYYTMKDGDTLAALLADAGLSAEADMDSIRIYVPRKGEGKQPQRVDINRAETWLLQALPNIGETRAQAIVDYRARNGPFSRADDLLKVAGISRTILDKMSGMITVGE